MQDYYDVLEVSPRAGHDVIDAAYRALTRRLSQTASDDPTAQRQRELVSEAYEVLSAPPTRQRYDARRIERSASGQLALTRSQRQAVGNPLVPFLRAHGRYLLTLFASVYLLWLLIELVTGSLSTWRDALFDVMYVAILTGAVALTFFASWYRMSVPVLVVACVSYTMAGYGLMMLTFWRSPSAKGVAMAAVFGAFLTFFTLLHALDNEVSPD